ncbi:MAG: M20 aminoacylase family protein [Candidatus Competibacterales bacterium]
MTPLTPFVDWHDEITTWRRDFHAHPELGYDVHRTAAAVAQKLEAFEVDEVITGLGKTGVVGVIRGRQAAPGVVGLRADMDALPIQELDERPYKSTVAGVMHACGHDGHTAMLLGAAKYLAATRRFAGTAVVIFQPAEEGGAGAKAMLDDGLMDRFAIQQVYGMHNMPGLPVGQFALRPGGIMAATDFFEIKVEGRGGHAARPHDCIDPATVAVQLVQGFQTIVARNVDPLESLVISTTQIHLGDTNNVIPQTATLGGTVRTLTPATRDLAQGRMEAICAAVGQAFGATVSLDYQRLYPVTVNHLRETAFAAQVAGQVVGESHVDAAAPPVMGGEDFSFMLEARPGAFIFIGQGDTAGLHHPRFDFNDAIIPTGCSYWARLVETALPLAA